MFPYFPFSHPSIPISRGPRGAVLFYFYFHPSVDIALAVSCVITAHSIPQKCLSDRAASDIPGGVVILFHRRLVTSTVCGGRDAFFHQDPPFFPAVALSVSAKCYFITCVLYLSGVYENLPNQLQRRVGPRICLFLVLYISGTTRIMDRLPRPRQHQVFMGLAWHDNDAVP